MKPNHIARARSFIGKRWYWRLRALKQRKMFSFWDKFVSTCDYKDTTIGCHELARYAKKEAYYAKKLNDGQRDKR